MNSVAANVPAQFCVPTIRPSGCLNVATCFNSEHSHVAAWKETCRLRLRQSPANKMLRAAQTTYCPSEDQSHPIGCQARSLESHQRHQHYPGQRNKSVNVSKSQGRPSPHHCAERDSPISSDGCGRNENRMPEEARIRNDSFLFHLPPDNIDIPGPQPAEPLGFKGVGAIATDRQVPEWVVHCSTGFRLPSQPGPHQRSMVLAANVTLPQSTAMRLPSARASLPSSGSYAPVALISRLTRFAMPS